MVSIGTSVSTRKLLMRAMHLDDSKQFRSILEADGWPLDSEWSDYELLTYAIKHNHRRITHLLLDKGARVTKEKRKLTSPLHMAAVKKISGWAKVIERLLSLGASVDNRNARNETALHLAFNAHASDEIIDTLLTGHLRKSSMDVFNREALGFIHIACTRPRLDVLREMLNTDPSLVNRQVCLKSDSSYTGYTPLHFAVDHGRLEVVEFLLEHGADIYKQSSKGSTALHLALEFRNISMIDLILRYDTRRINKVNNYGISHFMAACAGSDESLVSAYLQSAKFASVLINSQALNIKCYASSSYTPLHFAAEFGRQRTVELLLSQGANCCILGAYNATPHVLAHRGNHKKIVYLLNRQCNIYQWTTQAPKNSGEKYNLSLDQETQDNVALSFQRKYESDNSSSDEDSDDSSSDQDSDNSDMSILTHEDLLSFFPNDDAVDSAIELNFADNYNHPNLDRPKLQDESVALDLPRFSTQDLHSFQSTENSTDVNIQTQSSYDFTAANLDITDDSFHFADSHSLPLCEHEAQNQFASVNDASCNSDLSPIIPENVYSETIPQPTTSNNPVQCSTIQDSSCFTGPIQFPEIYSISDFVNDFCAARNSTLDSSVDGDIPSAFDVATDSVDSNQSFTDQLNFFNSLVTNVSQNSDNSSNFLCSNSYP